MFSNQEMNNFDWASRLPHCCFEFCCSHRENILHYLNLNAVSKPFSWRIGEDVVVLTSSPYIGISIATHQIVQDWARYFHTCRHDRPILQHLSCGSCLPRRWLEVKVWSNLNWKPSCINPETNFSSCGQSSILQFQFNGEPYTVSRVVSFDVSMGKWKQCWHLSDNEGVQLFRGCFSGSLSGISCSVGDGYLSLASFPKPVSRNPQSQSEECDEHSRDRINNVMVVIGKSAVASRLAADSRDMECGYTLMRLCVWAVVSITAYALLKRR